MKKSYQLALFILSIVLTVYAILFGQSFDLAAISILICVAIFKRDLVIWFFYGYIILDVLINGLSIHDIFNLLNTMLISYLVWINWRYVEGKTFSVFNGINVKGTIMLSAALQLLSLLALGINNPSPSYIIMMLVEWSGVMAFFIAIFCFVTRSINCFKFFALGSIINIVGNLLSILLANVLFSPSNLIYNIIFLIFILIILSHQQSRYKKSEL